MNIENRLITNEDVKLKKTIEMREDW